MPCDDVRIGGTLSASGISKMSMLPYRLRRPGASTTTQEVAMQKPDYWDRFWSKVDASGDCWEWTANRHRQGYGKFKIGGRTLMAHRVAWSLLIGPIPDDLTIDHLCRNTRCVNPDHLEPVDMRTNLLRGFNFVATNARKTVCRYGHPLIGANVFVAGRNSRFCVICHRRRSRESGRKKRAADALR